MDCPSLLFFQAILLTYFARGVILYESALYYKSAACSDPVLYQNVSALGECIGVYTNQGIEGSSFTWAALENTLNYGDEITYQVSSWKAPNCDKSVRSSIPEMQSRVIKNGACISAGTGNLYYKVQTQTVVTPPIDIAPSLVQWGYADSKSCMTQDSPLSVLAYPINSCVYIDVRHSMRYECSPDGLDVTILRYSNPRCSGSPLFKTITKLSTDGICVEYGDLGGALQRSAPRSGDLTSRNYVTFSCCLKRGGSSCSLYAPTAVPTPTPTTTPTLSPTNTPMPTYEVGKEPTVAPSEVGAPPPLGESTKKNGGTTRHSIPSLWPTVIVSLLLALWGEANDGAKLKLKK